MFHVPNQYRVRHGRLQSENSAGNNGMFQVGSAIPGRKLFAMASDGEGWEHVSVSCWVSAKKHRVPVWSEMCYVKGLFWDPADIVVQYHPRERDYVNFHPGTLHLWRPIGKALPAPPAILVGPRGVSGLQQLKESAMYEVADPIERVRLEMALQQRPQGGR